MRLSRMFFAAIGVLLIGSIQVAFAADTDTAAFAVDTTVKVMSDQRTRGMSDSLNGPGLKLDVQLAHESGFIGLAELSTVSKKQYLDGGGYNLTLAAGYRFGDPDAWHFGAGLASEFFPGAKFDAPHGFDFDTFTPTDSRTTKFDTSYAVMEIGYGALEGRILNVISKNYRGADTGGVCGFMLQVMADPTKGLECYARGDHNSHGSWLFDLGYKFNVGPATTLNLHAGVQKIKNFQEANFSDYSIGVTHKMWGLEWNADWVATHTKVHELFLVQDGAALRAVDGSKVVVSVSRKF